MFSCVVTIRDILTYFYVTYYGLLQTIVSNLHKQEEQICKVHLHVNFHVSSRTSIYFDSLMFQVITSSMYRLFNSFEIYLSYILRIPSS